MIYLLVVAEVLAAKAVETFHSDCSESSLDVAEVLAAKAVETCWVVEQVSKVFVLSQRY